MKNIFFAVFFLLLFADLLLANNWQKNNPNSSQKINHQTWNDFLQKNIRLEKNINKISYGSVTAVEKKILEEYLNDLQNIKISAYHSKEQKAYWINFYNALTVQTILEHYPVDSIRDIKLSGIFIPGPWKKKLVQVEGINLSLDNIEHEILRPIWKDNRVHYAVNCASIGCPNLQNKAFTKENIDQLLEKGAKEYIQDERGVQFSQGQLTISSIYKWFQEDFGGSEEGVLKHLQKYSTPSQKQQLQNYQGKIKYYYDWSLNN